MPSDEMLAKYVDVILQVGLAVGEGDRLLIDAPLSMPDFGRMLVDRAYQLGAENVEVLWSDDQLSRSRFEHGGERAQEAVADASRFKAMAFEGGTSFLAILAEDPAALSGIDPGRVQTFKRVNSEIVMPAREGQLTLRDRWAVVSVPVPAWTASVFGDAEEASTEKLWDAIFRACRVDRDDPIAEWRRHGAELVARHRYLTSRRYVGLRYHGEGTDLRLGLPENPVWYGGPATTQQGQAFFPNLPTEEVFAVPHRHNGDGVVAATKPLSYYGNLIEGFEFEVAGGRVVNARADRGQPTLDRILDTDDGSRHFGEVAMVPLSGAVAREGLVWNNALYDENDGCHIALGQSYPMCVEGGPQMSLDERRAAGLNQSTVHVDFVVGSESLDVFGIRSDGTEERILTGGEWAFEPG